MYMAIVLDLSQQWPLYTYILASNGHVCMEKKMFKLLVRN